MGAGGKEVTLDVFEWHLKKLLHIIDKLPKAEREKAVLILRNSANHYSNLTSGHPLPPPAPCPPAIYSSIHANQSLAEIPVSQVAKTFNLLKDENLMKNVVASIPSKDAPSAGGQPQQDLASAVYLTQHHHQHQPAVAAEPHVDFVPVTESSLSDQEILLRSTTTSIDNISVNTPHVSDAVSDIDQTNSVKLSESVSQQPILISNLDKSEKQNNEEVKQNPSQYSQMQTRQPEIVDEESESQAILDEIGRLGTGDDGTEETDGGGGTGVPTGDRYVEDGEDDWDQHILDGLQDVSQHSSISNISLNQSIQPLASMITGSDAGAAGIISSSQPVCSSVNAPSSVISSTLAVMSVPATMTAVAEPTVIGSSVSSSVLVNTVSEGSLTNEVIGPADMLPDVSSSSTVSSLESGITTPLGAGMSGVTPSLENSVSAFSTVVESSTASQVTGTSLAETTATTASLFESSVITSQPVVLPSPDFSSTATFFTKTRTSEDKTETSQSQCQLCFKRLTVVECWSPRSCRRCKVELCDVDCFTHHVSECCNIDEAKTSKSSKKKRKAKSDKKSQENDIEVPPDRKCESCDKVFTTDYTYKAHMAGHKENDCTKCGTKCATRKLLVAHLKTVHLLSTAVKFYDCKYCTRKFVKKPSLWFHYTSHATGTQKVCPKCGDFLDNEQLFDEHMAKHKEKMLSCDICGDIFSRKQQYEDHMKDHNKYSCNQCRKAFPSKKKLQHHRSQEHPTKGKELTKVTAKPKEEVNSMNEKQKIDKTAEVKKRKRSFKCGYCPFHNKNYKKVIRHEKRHKGYRKFVCELCGNAFNSENNLRGHVTYVHLDERKFKCARCEKTFKTKNSLIRHQMVHSDIRMFQCYCGKSYKRQSHLNRHFATTSHGYESCHTKRSIVGGPAYSGSLAPVTTCHNSEPFPVINNSLVTSTAGNNAGQLTTAVHANNSIGQSDFMMNNSLVLNNQKARKNVGEMGNMQHMEFYPEALQQCDTILEKKLNEYEGANLSLVDSRLNKGPDALSSMMMNQQMPATSSHLPDNSMAGKDFRKQMFLDNSYEKLKHYKIPKKNSGQTRFDPYQKYNNVRGLPQQNMPFPTNTPKQNQFNNKFGSSEDENKSFSNLQCIQNQNQRLMYCGPGGNTEYNRTDCNTDDRLPPVLFSEEERDILRGYPGDPGERMDYTSGAVMIPDKLNSEYDNNKGLGEQYYQTKHDNRGYFDKNSAAPDKGVDKVYNDKLYFQDKPYLDQKDIQLNDRNNCYDRGYMDTKTSDKQSNRPYSEDQRNYYDKNYIPLDITNEFLLNPLDCGPADLTVTSKDVHSGSGGVNTGGVDGSGGPPGTSRSDYPETGRDDYLNEAGLYKSGGGGVKGRGAGGTTANMMPGMQQRSTGGYTGMGGRTVDQLRGEIDDLVSLEETYRSSQDLGHHGRQNVGYYESLEPFNVLPTRGAGDSREDEFDKRHKFIKPDKYSRCDDYMGNRTSSNGDARNDYLGGGGRQESQSGRQDYLANRHNTGPRTDFLETRQDPSASARAEDYLGGGGRHDPAAAGSLPPLLALNPSLGGTEPISPPAQNYMCNNENENINPPYILPDSGLEYY